MSTVPEESEEEKEILEKTKKKGRGAFLLYNIEKGKIIRLRPTCERCGPGYFMAEHDDRFTCGKCGFTRYKPAEE